VISSTAERSLLRRTSAELAKILQPLELADPDKCPLDWRERLLEIADDRVATSEIALCVGRAAAKLILVDRDHRSSHLSEPDRPKLVFRPCSDATVRRIELFAGGHP
jgi:hypothetical protein